MSDETLRQLKDAEARYRGIFENAIEGIYQSTPDGRFVSVNAAMARMYGYDSPQDMLDSITDISKQMYVEPMAAGSIHFGLGDLSQFQRALEESFEERIGGCILLGVSPLFDSVRSEPFFQNLCRKIGLP